MTTSPEPASAGPAVWLAKGTHTSPDEGMCLLELVAYEQGLPHSDRPACVSPVLAGMGRDLNDLLPDEPRQRLLPIRHLLPGTAGDGHDEARSYLALDWLIRHWLPAWLDLTPQLRPHAEALRALPPVCNTASARQARGLVDAARAAAGAAAWDAAWDAARAAAEAAAEAAAWPAARAAHASGVDLQPTIDELQLSAIELYARMARLGRAAS